MVQVNEKWMKSEFRKTEPRATYTYDEQLKLRQLLRRLLLKFLGPGSLR